ncbi:hypothetical protein, partial [Collinsella tanakaei]|uniref:hypothetical protein n=1 Tax=Collinsella tanakaei TaxID=626935 RepID=UPI00265D4940
MPATPGREKLSLAFVQGERYPKRKLNALARVNVHFTYTDERFVFIGERFFARWGPMGLNQGARCWNHRQTRLSRFIKSHAHLAVRRTPAWLHRCFSASVGLGALLKTAFVYNLLLFLG